MSHADATQPVRPGDVLSVLIIVPAVAWVWVSFAEPVRFSTATLVGIAAAGAAVFGIPAWFWAADHVWTRLRGRLALGGAAGLGPPIAVLLSATLGVLWRDGAGDLEALFAQGAPIPGVRPVALAGIRRVLGPMLVHWRGQRRDPVGHRPQEGSALCGCRAHGPAR